MARVARRRVGRNIVVKIWVDEGGSSFDRAFGDFLKLKGEGCGE